MSASPLDRRSDFQWSVGSQVVDDAPAPLRLACALGAGAISRLDPNRLLCERTSSRQNFSLPGQSQSRRGATDLQFNRGALHPTRTSSNKRRS